jgi:predicted homoserine dehydrogenase-like protein
MIIVDKYLDDKDPIRVGMIGCGFMGKAIAYQLEKTPGINLVAISNRTIEKPIRAFVKAGINASNIFLAKNIKDLETNILNGVKVITEDPYLLCRSTQIDIIIEVTGTVEFASSVILEALSNKKHVLMMNPEVDGTVGLILKKYADNNGVILSNSDGDQPGVLMNQLRYVKGIGIKPVLCGNIKGFHNIYGNPSTQNGWAEQWGQNVNMVTSFCDGTKISFEQAIVANAADMTVAKRGMTAPVVEKGKHVKDCMDLFPLGQATQSSGYVDYIINAEPSPGVFIVGYCGDHFLMHYLNLFKMGKGPFYCFYQPYHLCFFDVPNSIARAVLFRDSTMSPVKWNVDVITAAKIELNEGDTLDCLGGYKTYGLAEDSVVVSENRLLPIGLSEGCVVKRKIERDQILTYDDIEIPKNRICDRLRNEQNNLS